MANLVTTDKLTGMRVLAGPKQKKLGKVRRFVFHPAAKRVVGFLVKRPDAALMFHRKDVFVTLSGFDIEDKTILLHDDPDASGSKAIKDLGVNWDDCVIWVGMPLMTMNGTELGYVGNVTFDLETGAVYSIEGDAGVANDAIVGKRVIPAKLIKGFKRGQGAALSQVGGVDENGDVIELGAIMVDDEAINLKTEGGVAEVAGKATAVAGDKVKKASVEAAAQAKRAQEEIATKVKPKVDKAAKEAGKAANKGAYAAGKHITATKNMFSDFKNEFEQALSDDDSASKKASTKAIAASSDAGATESEANAKPAAKKAAAKVSTKAASQAKREQAERERSAAIKKVAKKAGPAGGAVTAAGEQLNKMPGMFADFAEEFNKALNDDE